MPIVRPTYINATGGYQQPLSANADTITAGGFYAQNSATPDTNCGIVRAADTQLQLLAGGAPGLALNATGPIPTFNAIGVNASGVSLEVAGGQLATTSGMTFSDVTLQTTAAARTVRRTTSISTSGTTLVTTGLSFSLTTNTAYAIEGYIIMGRTVGVTANLRLQFSVSPTLVLSSYFAHRNANLPGTSGFLALAGAPFATQFNLTPNASGTASTTYAIPISGVFAVAGVNPTIDLRFAPAFAGDELTVYPGSYLSIRSAFT